MAYVSMSDLSRVVGMGQAAPAQVEQAAVKTEDVAGSPSSIPSHVMGVPTTYLVLGVGTIGLIALVAALKKKRREPEIGYYGYPPPPQQYGYPQYGYVPQGYYDNQQAMPAQAAPPAIPAPQPSIPAPQQPQGAPLQPQVAPTPQSSQVAKNRPRGRRKR